MTYTTQKQHLVCNDDTAATAATRPRPGSNRLHTHGNEKTRLRQGRRRRLCTILNEDDRYDVASNDVACNDRRELR